MTSQPQPDFDRVARIYRWAEWLTLGPLLERTREHFIGQIADRRQALILGDGDGRFLAALLEHNSHLQAVAVDTSAVMLSLLRKRCSSNAARVMTKQTSALAVNAPPSTDLIVTHFLLDCFTQPEVDALTLRLAAQTAPGTLWLLSDFALSTQRILRPFTALYIRALYLAFRILTGLQVTQLPDPQRSLLQAGFERIERHQLVFGLLYTELWRRR
jgi:SAM-dependent methyltransferase